MNWQGGCLCGAVRYRAAVEPDWVGSCHCSMCHKWTGAAFLTGACFPPGAIEWTEKAPKYYISSSEARRGFCAECGSSLIYESEDTICVTAGSLDDVTSLRPVAHHWTTTWLPWLHLDDGLPRFARRGDWRQQNKDR